MPIYDIATELDDILVTEDDNPIITEDSSAVFATDGWQHMLLLGVG